jgi:predicted N-acyltransferase
MRVPSLPMRRLGIDYPSFDEYLKRALSRKARQDVRVKLRAAAKAEPIELAVVCDFAPFIDEAYPLYLQLYEGSTMRFERLTREFFCELGRRMPARCGSSCGVNAEA